MHLTGALWGTEAVAFYSCMRKKKHATKLLFKESGKQTTNNTISYLPFPSWQYCSAFLRICSSYAGLACPGQCRVCQMLRFLLVLPLKSERQYWKHLPLEKEDCCRPYARNRVEKSGPLAFFACYSQTKEYNTLTKKKAKVSGNFCTVIQTSLVMGRWRCNEAHRFQKEPFPYIRLKLNVNILCEASFPLKKVFWNITPALRSLSRILTAQIHEKFYFL